MKIAVIGLGNMGAPMAGNLIKSGFDVVGYDVTGGPADLPCADSAGAAAKGADVVVTMLPNGAIARAVAEDVMPHMRFGTTLIDCSTIDVGTARDIFDMASPKGVHVLDAPVSGGVGGAENGTLTFMVGGCDKAFAAMASVFDAMGQKAVYCGGAGSGQAAKICNNMILGITMIGTCEAIGLADALGLDRQALFDVVSTSSGASWSMNTYCPAPGVGPTSPADAGYKPGFSAGLMLKDLGLAQMAAQESQAPTPLGAQARDLYAQFVDMPGGADKDFSAMLVWLADQVRGDTI
ncbi:MAG: 3-hydroxyisobutyrate dehydrogenase [Pseudomonadota bacterium]